DLTIASLIGVVQSSVDDPLIPTINILHTENFKEYMRQTIEAYIEIEEKDKFELLIEDISLFITDMRTLINICNEFKVYQERLKNSKLLDTEILPFIVYKNIYPVDFSRLLRSEGLLFKVFNDEGRYKEELVNQKKILISHGSLIEKKEDILLLFFRRIPRKFINKTIFYNNNAIGSLRDDNQIGIINSLKTIFEFFEKDNENKEIYIKTLAYGETIEVINNKEELFTINRINYLDYYFNMEGNNKVKLDEQLKALDEKLDAISRMSISQLVRDNIISLPEEVQKEELLHYLISHNWINESYKDLLSGFIEGDLKSADREFLKSVKSGKNQNLMYQELNKPSMVLSKVNIVDINSFSIVNLSLIKEILNSTDINLNRALLKKIIKIIYEENDLNNIIIILQSLDKKKRTEFLNEVSPNYIWSDNLYKNELETQNIYADILLNLEPNIFKKRKDYFTEFISQTMDLYYLTNQGDLSISLKHNNIKFKNISRVTDGKILSIIKESGHFEINLENFQKLVGNELILYESICDDKYLKKYTNESVEELVDKVIVVQENYKIKNLNDSLPYYLIQRALEEFKIEANWYNITLLLNNEDINNESIQNWLLKRMEEFIDNSTQAIQKEYIEKEMFTEFIKKVSILLSEKEINSLVKKLKNKLSYESLENNILLEKLVEHDKIDWNVNYYNLLDNSILRKTYIINNANAASSHFEELIQNDNLPWIQEVYEQIVGNTDLASEYLNNNKKEIIVKKEIFEEVLNLSTDADYLMNMYLLNVDYKNDINLMEKLSQKLFDLKGNEFIVRIDQDIHLFLNSFDSDVTASLLMEYLSSNKLSQEDIFKVLSKLEKPYNKIKLKGTDIVISSKNKEQVSLFEYFIKKDVLANKHPNGQEIKYTNKRK
ncbi:MAG: YobI family P-loop NTPase, partial [Staphylococcus equorum]